MVYLDGKIDFLHGTPLIAIIIWLVLLFFIILIMIFSSKIKRMIRNKDIVKNKSSVNEKDIPKGF